MPELKTFLRTPPRYGQTLRAMYTYPLVYGTPPGAAKWSPDNRTLAFLWNPAGELCMDIYISRDDGPPQRLTDAAASAATPVEDDERPPEDVRHAELIDPGVTAFDWSPDGAWLAFLCRGNLYRIPVQGGPAVCLFGGTPGKSDVQVAGDGRRIGFRMNHNVWAYDVQQHAVTQLTFFAKEHVAVERYAWSPDGRWLAVAVEDRSMYDLVRMPDYTPVPGKGVEIHELRRCNVGRPRPKVRVGIVPAAGGKLGPIPLPALDEDGQPVEAATGDEPDTGTLIHLNQLCWTWDSSRLLVSYRSSATYHDWHLRAADPECPAQAVEVYAEADEPWFCYCPLAVSPDSQYAYFQSWRTGWQHVYRVPIAGGAAQPVTQGAFDVARFVVPRKGTRLFYTAYTPDPQENHVFAVPLDGGGTPAKLALDLPWSDVFPADDGRTLAFTCSGIMTPPEIYRGANDQQPTRITHSPRPAFAEIPRPIIKRFALKNESDGVPLRGTMMLPHNFDPAKKHPAVLSCVYAGRGKDAWGRYQLIDAYMANELGYVVIGLDLPATTGYGKDFFYGYHKRMGLIDAAEVVSCASYLRTLPYIDARRIGIWGGSYGGFLVLMAMCNHPGVFHTGVSWKPVTDWRNYDDDYTGERLTRPENAPEVYKATSPVYHAQGLVGNLLIIHGMQDDNVLFQDCVWMVQRLIEAGKYFDLALYPRDDHLLTLRRESLADCAERVAAYFERHMGLGPV